MKKILSFMFLAAVALLTVFTSCIDNVQPETVEPGGTIFFSVKAKLPDIDTKGLYFNGMHGLGATWDQNEPVKVYKGGNLVGTLTAVPDGQDATKASLSGQISNTVQAKDELTLTIKSNTNYDQQDGTIAFVEGTCDYATATVTVSSVEGNKAYAATGATFSPQQAVVHFTFLDESGDAFSPTSFVIKYGDRTINVPTNQGSKDNIYIAIPGAVEKDITVTIVKQEGADVWDPYKHYSYEKKTVTFENGKFYRIMVQMKREDYFVPLTFEAVQAGAKVTFTAGTSITFNENDVQISTDGSNWSNYPSGSEVVLANVGDKVMFRGSLSQYGNDLYTASTGSRFSVADGTCYVYGNIMSLVNKSDFATATALPSGSCTFSGLFYENTNILNHPEKSIMMPATTLRDRCYFGMFQGCTGLTRVPKLPATDLTGADRCYKDMFYACTGIIKGAQLPATTLSEGCYWSMFQGCTSLDYAAGLGADKLKTYCYRYMYYGCEKLGTAPLIKATTFEDGEGEGAGCCSYMFGNCTLLKLPKDSDPEKQFKLEMDNLPAECYQGMFKGCSSLDVAPDLPAETLVGGGCYQNMFEGCSSLKTAPTISATTLTNSCYANMFKNCSQLTSAPTLGATALADYCYFLMFDGCTSLKTAPSLPATALKPYCYKSMFWGCTSLTTAPALSATELKDGCYTSMFYDCSALSSAPVLSAPILVKECYQNMFYGCSNLSSVTCLATSYTTSSLSGCTSSWLYGVAVSGTFTKAASAEIWSRDQHGIPEKWTVQTPQQQ